MYFPNAKFKTERGCENNIFGLNAKSMLALGRKERERQQSHLVTLEEASNEISLK